MRVINTIILLCLFSMTMFAQTPDCTPVVNGQFTNQLVDTEHMTYYVKLQINISEYGPQTIDYAKLKFIFNSIPCENSMQFDSARVLNFTSENGYELDYLYLDNDSKIRVKFHLNGCGGFEVGETYVDFMEFYFTILDVNGCSNICKDDLIFKYDGNNMDIGEWLCDESPLPVELTSFTATNVNNNVILNWETATELNNYGFNIQRNGETVGFVPGYGNSNSPKSYSFTDVPKSSGTYLYRLQQINIDGTTELSSEVFVDIVLNKFELNQNYPNPFNPSTTIGFFLNKSEKITLVVYDIIGNQVVVLADGIYNEGYNEVVFNANNLSSGLYIYKLQTESNSVVKKMTLLK